jgi:protein-S-isoprenylcysteine O-methyltransferase Ste14
VESWLNGWLIFNKSSTMLISIEIILFVTGSLLFLISFFQLASGLISKKTVVTTGIYKYIRHPQNLGIIILSAPFALYVPVFKDFGIRMGDIFSYIQFVFFLIIYSDMGDLILQKKFPDESQRYFECTGFMFPKLISITKYVPFLKIRIVKYFSLCITYFLITILIYFLRDQGKIPLITYF